MPHNNPATDQDIQLITDILEIPVQKDAHNFSRPKKTIIEDLRGISTENNTRRSLPGHVQEITDYYASTNEKLKFNPSDDNMVLALNQVYLLINDENVKSVYLSSSEGFKKFKNCFVNKPNVRIIFIKGEKGSGKTMFINAYLNNNVRFLEKNEKILVYKIDVDELYQIWKVKKDETTDLKHIFANKVPYVTLKYKDKSPAFREITAEFEKRPSPAFQSIDECLNSARTNSDTDKINSARLKKKIATINKEKDLLLFYDFVETIRNKGFKINLVIDGIDNYDYALDSEHYEEFLKQLGELWYEKDEFYIDKFVILMRKETFNHLRTQDDAFYRGSEYECLELKHGNVERILKNHREAIVDPKGTLLDLRKESEINTAINEQISNKIYMNSWRSFENFKNFDESFSKFCNTFLLDLQESLNKVVTAHQFTDVDEMVECLCNGNIREFYNYFINAYSYHLLIKSYTSRVPKISELLESLVLNGRMYFDSEKMGNIQHGGYLIPNVFWFDVSYCNGKWHGLCGIRILQMLMSNSFPCKKDILNKLVMNFKYNEDIITERFNTLQRYGLIGVDGGSEKTNKDTTDMPKKTYVFKITEKGRYLLHFYFCSIDVFYALAIDTPLILSGKDGTFSSNEIFIHYSSEANPRSMWVDYLEASVKTSLTLMRHIKTFYDTEMSGLDCKIKPTFEFNESINNDLKGLKDSIINNFRRINKNMSKIKVKEDFRNDLKGIVDSSHISNGIQ